METLGYILATIIALTIILIPLALIVLFVIWLYKKVLGSKKQKSTTVTGNTSWNNGPYETGWTWNENTKLWEPPANMKATQQQTGNRSETSYRLTKDSIRQDNPSHSSYHPEKDTQQTEAQKTRSGSPGYDRYVTPNISGIQGYKAKCLLTPNEWHEHKKLREYAAQKGLYVCPKVRLLDLVTPYGNGKDYMTRFHKVQAKHVDFVLVDNSMHIKAIVELDDSSHDTKERQERDQFIDEVLSGVGYTVIHTRCINENTLSRL